MTDGLEVILLGRRKSVLPVLVSRVHEMAEELRNAGLSKIIIDPIGLWQVAFVPQSGVERSRAFRVGFGGFIDPRPTHFTAGFVYDPQDENHKARRSSFIEMTARIIAHLS